MGSDPLGSSSTIDSSQIDNREMLVIRMDRIVDDSLPFDVTVRCSKDTVALPLSGRSRGGEPISWGSMG